jgi:hypothetical protein
MVTERPLLPFSRPSEIQERVSVKEFVVINDSGKTIAWFGGLLNGAATGLILTPKGFIPTDWKPPKYVDDLLTATEKFGGSVLIAAADSSEFSLSDNQKNGKADTVSLSANSLPDHESMLRLTGRDGMVTSLGVMALKTETESASLLASQPLELGNSKVNRHVQEVETKLDSDGAGALEFSEEALKPHKRLAVDMLGIPELNFSLTPQMMLVPRLAGC